MSYIKNLTFEEVLELKAPPTDFELRPPPTDAEIRETMNSMCDPKVGILNHPKLTEREDGSLSYGDGHRRIAAFKLAIKEENPRWFEMWPDGVISFAVEQKTDLNLLISQVVGNNTVKPTTNAAYAKALRHIMLTEPSMTVTKLAETIHSTPDRVVAILSLNKLPEKAAQLLDEKEMTLGNALVLAKVPKQVLQSQPELIAAAATMTTAEFPLHVDTIIDDFRKLMKGDKQDPDVYTHVPVFVKKEELLAMYKTAKEQFELRVDDYSRGRMDALAEAVGFDDATYEEGKAAWAKVRENNKKMADARAAIREKQKAEGKELLEKSLADILVPKA